MKRIIGLMLSFLIIITTGFVAAEASVFFSTECNNGDFCIVSIKQDYTELNEDESNWSKIFNIDDFNIESKEEIDLIEEITSVEAYNSKYANQEKYKRFFKIHLKEADIETLEKIVYEIAELDFVSAVSAGGKLNMGWIIDINGSDELTAADALTALQIAVGKINMDGEDISEWDTDGNGVVTASDALTILQIAVGKLPQPVPGE